MKILFRFLFLFCFIFGIKQSKASHIIGGDLTYECVSGTTYSITVIMYRDCNPGSANFFSISLEAFNLATNASVLETESIMPDLIEEIDFTGGDPCVELPPNICVEKATYTYTIHLDASLDGYVLAASTCCLANNVQNINNALGTGIIANSIIPPLGNGNPACFDSPLFNEDPPTHICLNDPLNLDLGAYLPNPDPTITLVHSFYTPEYEGTLQPPFDPVTFVPPYSANSPVSTVSGLNIDPNTGLITGTVNEIGYFYIGVRVFAVKNGDTISSINRPFRYYVADCNINEAVPLLAAPVVCGDLNVNFANLSTGADEFRWNFGDESSGASNLSTLFSPSHTFSAFGSYEVQLITIANGDVGCSDTTTISLSIDSAATSEMDINSDYQCLAANNFNFEATSNKPEVTYEWDFGPTASLQTSTDPNPENISYNEVGTYTIKLTTKYKECLSEITRTVEVFDGLLAEVTGPTEGCIPFEATFVPSVINPDFTYTWRSNGKEITAQNGVFNYHNPGVYSVELYVVDKEGCESTDYQHTYFTAYEVPETGFTISNKKLSVGETITIENTVEKDYKIEFVMISPSVQIDVETSDNFSLTMADEGVFSIVQTVSNNDICVSSETQFIDVGPPSVDPPNVFTPNKDGVNDYLFIEPYNNRNIEFRVYDRWGMLVFSSDNYELCNDENTEYCWDGYDVSGNKCIEGIYFYSVALSNGFNKNGVINLFK